LIITRGSAGPRAVSCTAASASLRYFLPMALDLHDRSVPHCRCQSLVVEREHFAGQLAEGLQFVPPDVVPVPALVPMLGTWYSVP